MPNNSSDRPPVVITPSLAAAQRPAWHALLHALILRDQEGCTPAEAAALTREEYPQLHWPRAHWPRAPWE